ncbi:hypothetical protein HYDPIDRAFT_115544 [Hydnomerulius pinastri MD-312]|uniref:Uncharacterized protein n=1 Tax=Hydnomerulius pinastri MD-312 TaxID=994086 RepID=A0A0C9WCM0_9AGAM|nr:hypothetical protein HYDPIDRAFT_115544 [Hydnomerulius pinastri MD-312]
MNIVLGARRPIGLNPLLHHESTQAPGTPWFLDWVQHCASAGAEPLHPLDSDGCRVGIALIDVSAEGR